MIREWIATWKTLPICILFRFFFHYSGHGGRVYDAHSDEEDSYDETIYPLDFQDFDGESGQLKDDASISREVLYKRNKTHF